MRKFFLSFIFLILITILSIQSKSKFIDREAIFDKKILDIFSLGNRKLITRVFWTHALLSSIDKCKNKPEVFFNKMNQALNWNPDSFWIYKTGANILDIECKNYDFSIQILDKGIKYFENNQPKWADAWMLYMQAAILNLYEKKEIFIASKYFNKLKNFENLPFEIKKNQDDEFNFLEKLSIHYLQQVHLLRKSSEEEFLERKNKVKNYFYIKKLESNFKNFLLKKEEYRIKKNPDSVYLNEEFYSFINSINLENKDLFGEELFVSEDGFVVPKSNFNNKKLEWPLHEF